MWPKLHHKKSSLRADYLWILTDATRFLRFFLWQYYTLRVCIGPSVRYMYNVIWSCWRINFNLKPIVPRYVEFLVFDKLPCKTHTWLCGKVLCVIYDPVWSRVSPWSIASIDSFLLFWVPHPSIGTIWKSPRTVIATMPIISYIMA